MPVFDAHAYWTDSPLSGTAANRDGLLAAMNRYGATQVGLISGLAADCDFVAGNRALAQVLDPTVGLYGYAVLSADYAEESQQEMRQWLTKSEFLGGVLFGHSGEPVTVDDARDILNAYRRFSKPMAIYVPDADAVHAARAIAAEFPAMKFVLLGMGGDHWRTALGVAKKHLNVYLEISGSLDSDKVAHAAEALTPRKILFGSGFPLADPQAILGLVEAAPTITNADRDRIRSQNAAALFNV
jgi:predicted TIM-barrel fold metal-dependent hydrolase